MKQITVSQLLKLLPMEDKLRQEILSELPKYNDDQKLSLSRLCWMMYYELIEAETQYEFKKMLVDAKDGRRKLSSDMYQQIENQVVMRFKRNLREEQEAEMVDEVREKLKAIVAENLKTKPLPQDKLTSPPPPQKPFDSTQGKP